MARFEIIDHTADIGIRAYGKGLGEVFANAAYGMFSIITDLNKVYDDICHDIEVEASDVEELLVSWLNELLYVFDTENVLFCRFDIDNISQKRLQARAWGEKVDRSRHAIMTSIKAATYHMISVEKRESGFTVQVILDI